MVHIAESMFFEYMDSLTEDRDLKISSTETNNETDLSSYYKEELKRIEQKEKRIKQAYRDGIDTIEEYKENKAILQSEKDNVMLKMANTTSKSNVSEKTNIIQIAHQTSDMMKSEQFSVQEKNEALKQVVEKIVYSKDEQKMQFFFYGQSR
jgi:hypothetical protein